MKGFLKKHGGNGVFFFLLLVLGVIHFQQKNSLCYTGDEPRLTYYSYSIVKGAMLKYPVDEFVKTTGSVDPCHTIINEPIKFNMFNKHMFMMNSIVAPLFYSPGLLLGNAFKAWELLRTSAFLYYCGALIFIWISLKKLFSTRVSLLAIAMTALCAPQLVQMSLSTTEQMAIFFLAAAFYYLIVSKVSVFSIITGTIATCLVIYASMRSIPLAGAVGIGFLFRLKALPSEAEFSKWKGYFLFSTVSIPGALGWMAMQLSFTGAVFGSSLLNETLFGKTPLWFLERLFVPLIHHHDGIFFLFPMVFLSFLGLIYAAIKRDLVALVCLGGGLVYYFLISLTFQAEGYPGRLQFVLVEFFIVGLAFYIKDFKSIAARVILALGALVSSISVFMHLKYPYVLVMNRQFGLFQQMILEKLKILDFGKFIIWDKHSTWTLPTPPLLPSDAWLKVMFFLTCVGVLLLLSLSKKRGGKMQTASAWCALLVTIIGASSLFVYPVANKSIAVVRSNVDGCGSIHLTFSKAIASQMTMTFGIHPFWQPPEYPSYFNVSVELENGTFREFKKRTMPEIRLPAIGKVKSITISGDRSKEAWHTLPVKVYSGVFSI